MHGLWLPRRWSVGTVAAVAWWLCAMSQPRAQSEADVAIRFFEAGGAYCVRVSPEGVSLSDETEWTVLLLTAMSNRGNIFRIRTVDPGATGLAGRRLSDVGAAITSVWRRESLREDFFKRFAAGIEGHALRARVVRITPPRLAEMDPGQRAEAYLKFADRGSKVDFTKTADLKAEEFLAFEAYLPD